MAAPEAAIQPVRVRAPSGFCNGWPGQARPHEKTPSRTRAVSASPAARPLLDRILERLTAIHRFSPCLLQPVVPYRRDVRVLNKHLRRRKFKHLILQFHDSAVLGQQEGREWAKQRC